MTDKRKQFTRRWVLPVALFPSREVLHVALLFLRVISACADGKIRIYNFLNGNCLKVMKANGRGDPVLSFFIQGNRMVINTESNVLMFQFENIKWQYPLERAKQKTRDKEEDREENGLTEVLSKSSTQIYSPRDSLSSKQVAQESLLSKPHKSCISLKASRSPTASPHPDRHSAPLTEAALSQGKPKPPRRDGRKRMSPRDANGRGGQWEQETLEAKPLPGGKNGEAPFITSAFMLWTVKEQKEYGEAMVKEYQARKPAGVVNPEKASKAAWIRKIEGLPIDNFMKQGKTTAPELGQNIFI
nr:F-box/WD repeat-containing protein 10-like [Vicugna pacos]